MGGSSSTCNCCASFITFCEETFGTNNCTLCGVDIAATGIEFCDDYLQFNKIQFLKSSKLGKEIVIIPYKALASVKLGVLDVSTPSGLSIYQYLQNQEYFTVASEGSLYISGLDNTLMTFRKNLTSFTRGVNIMTSLATSQIIATANQNINIINDAFAQKLGFTVSQYNYYQSNPYYDYYSTFNLYALELVRVNALVVVLWHIIYSQVILLGINLTDNYPFYITFYQSIFNNLNKSNAIFSYQINPYFVKYTPNIIPASYDPIIEKISSAISSETDIITILQLKYSTRLSSEYELSNANFDKNSTSFKLSRESIKANLIECIQNRNYLNASVGLQTKPFP